MADDRPDGGLHVDGLRALYEQAPASLGGNAIGIGVVGLAFWPLAEPPRLLAWLAVAGVLWLLRLAHYQRYRAARDSGQDTLLAWRTSWRALVLAQGAMWPLAVWLFWGLGAPFHELALIVIANSYTLASVQLLAPQRRLFIVFSCMILLPTIARVASDTTQPWHWQLAGVLGLVFAIAMLLGRAYRSALGQAIGLKQRTEQLAAQLRVEKAAADEARRSAEAANRAKSQFFAAASHDLRQPLHAMGLFAEALRQRANDPEVASLVNSINQSVDALEGLFGELLDITRIDSGGVDVQPGPVSVKDLFARLRLTFEATAFEKGLALAFHGAQRFAHTDGLLLERILRNLVSNAIRYSEDGGVLVACRPKPGDRRQLAVPGLGQRHRHRAGQPAAHLRRVLPGADQPPARGPPEEGHGPGAGHRQAAGRSARGPAHGAFAGGARLGVHARGTGRARAAWPGAGGAERRRQARRHAAGPPPAGGRRRAHRARGPDRLARDLGRRGSGAGRHRLAAAVAGPRPTSRRPTCCSSTTGCRRAVPASRRWPRCAHAGPSACCRRSWSRAAAWAATRTRPAGTISTC